MQLPLLVPDLGCGHADYPPSLHLHYSRAGLRDPPEVRPCQKDYGLAPYSPADRYHSPNQLPLGQRSQKRAHSTRHTLLQYGEYPRVLSAKVHQEAFLCLLLFSSALSWMLRCAQHDTASYLVAVSIRPQVEHMMTYLYFYLHPE